MTVPQVNECTVVNLHSTDDYDVYIGRKGRGWSGYFGNPFRRKTGEAVGVTLGRFKAYFLERVRSDPEFKARALELRGHRLGCFCKPNPCHGDVIAEWVNSQAPRVCSALYMNVGSMACELTEGHAGRHRRSKRNGKRTVKVSWGG